MTDYVMQECGTLVIITVLPRLTKIFRSGITFVSRNFSLSRK